MYIRITAKPLYNNSNTYKFYNNILIDPELEEAYACYIQV